MNAQEVSGPMQSFGLILATMFLSSPLWADDLTDSNSLLCYGWSAARCSNESECVVTEAWHVNMPDFLKIDLEAGIAVSTETAPEGRVTQIQTIEREDGTIILQGRQDGRIFSWLITEATGEGVLTVSTAAEGITVFTVCTPIENL